MIPPWLRQQFTLLARHLMFVVILIGMLAWALGVWAGEPIEDPRGRYVP